MGIGDLIMITADVTETLQTILPVPQNFLPVALKRKIQYSGYFIQEFVDREKLKQYYLFFKNHNHIYENISFDDKLIDEFEQNAMKLIKQNDQNKNNLLKDHEKIVSTEVCTVESDDDEIEIVSESKPEEHRTCDTST